MAYGGAGNSTIEAEGQVGDTIYGGSGPIDSYIFLGNSALNLVYGVAGDDTLLTASIELENTVADTTYGGQGNDSIISNNSTGNTFYGGGGNDTIFDDTISERHSSADVLYGNQGNDVLEAENAFALTAYGGQGNDTVNQDFSAHSAFYGNKENDFTGDFAATGAANALDDGAGAAEGNSVLYGGQGDDTLVAVDAGGDTMFGGPGDNLFVGNDLSTFSPNNFTFTTNDFITVGGFATGNDSLSMSRFVSGNGANFQKEADSAANNAADALSLADAYYTNHGSSLQYLFIYGGSGAGYLLYNGLSGSDSPASAPTDGMILVGDDAESSLSANDVVASNFA